MSERNYSEDICIGSSELLWASKNIAAGEDDRASGNLQGIIRVIGLVDHDECRYVWQIARLAEKALWMLIHGQGDEAAREIREFLGEHKDFIAAQIAQYRAGIGMEVSDE